MVSAALFHTIMWCPCVGDMVHVANVLYLCSYLVRDILWLRVLTIAAGLSLIPFYCHCSDHILWAPIGWNAVFVSVNLVQIGILLRERRPRRLGGAEQELYDTVFADLAPGEFRKLMKVAQWRDVTTGSIIVERDNVVADMMVLKQGGLEVRVGDRVIAILQPGQFIGEMSFLSGERATADVVATEGSRLLVWSQADLNEFLERRAALAHKLRGILGRDVVAKLRAHGQPSG